ncbi:transglycosylase family protein, partial [Mycolicibacterium canariasense]
IGPDQMQLGDQIRDFLQSHAEELGLEYTIWRDQGVYPGTGGKTAFTTPGHQNHIDAKFDGTGGAAGALSAATNGPVPVSVVNGSTMLSGFNWDAVAAKESSGNWQNADTGGNGHFGGLQFSPSTWNAYGGQEFAPMPHQATREQQMAVADRTAFYGYNGTPPQGLGAWEVITNGSTAPAGITVNSQPPSAGWGQPTGPLPTVGPGGGYGITGGPGQAGGPGMGPMPLGPAPLRLAGPGVGAAAGTPLGGLPPVNGSGGGGIGMASGGVADMAMQAGGMALDAMAPGAGQAAQTGMKLINRAIEFGTQAIGIGASGLMETLLPTGGSQLANSNWLTKIAGGVAGAGAALPNTAGQSAAALAGPPSGGDQAAAAGGNGPTYYTEINAGPDRSGAGIARDFEYHTGAANRGPGM